MLSVVVNNQQARDELALGLDELVREGATFEKGVLIERPNDAVQEVAA